MTKSPSFDVTNFQCPWDEDAVCHVGMMCSSCKHQPAPEDKKNGKAPPIPLRWRPDITGRGMGFPCCPACGEQSFSTKRCVYCGQRFIQDEKTRKYNEPPLEISLDCPLCGGKGTLIGYRPRSNERFRGECKACGCLLME